MKENIDNTNPIDLESDNKKLTFDSNLDTNANLEYINRWNDNFIRDPDFDDEKQDYKKPIDKIIETDLSEFKKQIYTKQNTNDQGKYGVISEKFMSELMFERLYLMDWENILWEFLNANKNFTNVNNESIAEVDLSSQLNKTQNSRIEKLMNTNFNDRLIKDNNYDANNVENYYFEYAKSKYVDRYFFYFSRLRDLSEYSFENTKKEYGKYNIENIKKVEAEMEQNKANIEKLQCQRRKQEEEADQASNNTSSEISQLKNKNDQESINQLKKLNNNLIAKKQLVTDTNQKITELQTQNLELQKILDHPLTKFYKEHKERIEIVKQEIEDIKKGWKRQYEKFIFAYMLEHPERISNLEKIVEKHWTKETAIAFSEFLIKQTNHKNFSYACLEFDNLLNSRNSSFDAPSRQAKLDLYEKYENEIKSLDQNKRIVINSLLCENYRGNMPIFKKIKWALCITLVGIFGFFVIPPLLRVYAILSAVSPVFLIVCCTTVALLIVNTILSGAKTPFEYKYTKSALLMGISGLSLVPEIIAICCSLSFYPYLPALSISLLILCFIIVACVTAATISVIYKKIQCYYFEKRLRRPPEEKDLSQALNQYMSKENDKLSDINNSQNNNNFPLFSDLDSSVEISNNVKNK